MRATKTATINRAATTTCTLCIDAHVLRAHTARALRTSTLHCHVFSFAMRDASAHALDKNVRLLRASPPLLDSAEFTGIGDLRRDTRMHDVSAWRILPACIDALRVEGLRTSASHSRTQTR
jgi:hypothetical protein